MSSLLYIVRFLHQTTTKVEASDICASLYIVRFLHQTTTVSVQHKIRAGCISSVSYIKPQPRLLSFAFSFSCISSVSYIKPQLPLIKTIYENVVYRPFPTSNHNHFINDHNRDMLYIVRFLHQTTTVQVQRMKRWCCISSVSYIKPQPPNFQLFENSRCISSVSYIKPQRLFNKYAAWLRCISSVSYIKPQLVKI